MTQLLDTQIISFKYKNSKEINIENGIIPSVVAMEFLLTISSRATKANYYIPNVSKFHYNGFNSFKLDHPFQKISSDQIIFDFGQLTNSFTLFSNLSITELINAKNVGLYDASISFLEKDVQKDLKKKIRFLLDHNISCEAISGIEIEKGYELLNLFLKEHDAKKNFRNTWNDILILSKAISTNTQLVTEDNLLNRFAAKVFKIKLEENDGLLNFDFRTKKIDDKLISKESKGYINKGWDYKIRK